LSSGERRWHGRANFRWWRSRRRNGLRCCTTVTGLTCVFPHQVESMDVSVPA